MTDTIIFRNYVLKLCDEHAAQGKEIARLNAALEDAHKNLDRQGRMLAAMRVEKVSLEMRLEERNAYACTEHG